MAVELIDHCYHGDPLSAVQEAVDQLEGSYALGILFSDYPWQLICVRKDSPLILGLGDGENFIASDIPALIAHTRDIIRLGERELAVVGRDGVAIFDRLGERVTHPVQRVDGTWPRRSGAASSTSCSRRSWSRARPCTIR